MGLAGKVVGLAGTVVGVSWEGSGAQPTCLVGVSWEGGYREVREVRGL